MSKNILEALGKIDVALGGNANDAVNVIDALDQISQGAGSLKTSVDSINGVQMKICGTGEYDAETGIPTVENPVEGVFYLTPAGQQDNNVFNEYYYKNGSWEMFGGASINVDDLFDLSDRMAKGVDDNGDVVKGAIIEGTLSGSFRNKASGKYSHAECFGTIASGSYSHAEGYSTIASGQGSHAEGSGTVASNYQSHTEGTNTKASGINSHAEGSATIANHKSQHVFGEFNIEDPSTTTTDKRGNYVEIVGNGTATQVRSNARTLDWFGNEVLAGKLTVGTGPTENMDVATKQYVDEHAGSGSSSGLQNFVDGSTTGSVRGINTAVEDNNYTIGQGAVAEGGGTKASGNYSHAEGGGTTASGDYSHAEGVNTKATGIQSHAEGNSTTASGSQSHAEGSRTTASSICSHAEGAGTTASGIDSHAEGGDTTASGNNSHAEGSGTIANHRSQHVFGEFNIADTSENDATTRGNYIEIVGNGMTSSARSNARTLDWNGNETLSGSLSLASSLTLGKGTADEVTITAAQLKSLLAKLNQ